jgi:hypothetical protein
MSVLMTLSPVRLFMMPTRAAADCWLRVAPPRSILAQEFIYKEMILISNGPKKTLGRCHAGSND